MKALFNKYLEMPNDSKPKTLFVAISLCLVCSILVSAAAVALRPKQEANKVLDKRKNILQIGGLMQAGKSVNELFEGVEARVVDLDTGEYVDDVDPAVYDAREAAKDPAQSRTLAAVEDIASIKRREQYATVYLVRDESGEAIERFILPVRGYGLWSTLHGFMALEGDGQTVSGFGFYEHAETPGLGGEVDNPNWRALWPGKQVYDDDGAVALQVMKGSVDPQAPGTEYQVDGLAGATLTSRGVSNLVQYWLGDSGFAKYLDKKRTLGG